MTLKIDGGGDDTQAILEQQRAAEEARRRREAEEAARRLAEQQNAQRQANQRDAMTQFAERLGLDQNLFKALFQQKLPGGDLTTNAATTTNSNPLNIKPSSTTTATAESDLAQRLQYVKQAMDAAQKAWASLPPDASRVSLQLDNNNASPLDQWKTGARASLGPGDAVELDHYLDDNKETLNALAQILGNRPAQNLIKSGQLFGIDPTPLEQQLYAPVIAGLKQANPDAIFDLVAVKQGTMQDRNGSPLPESDIVIAMTRKTPNGGSNTQYLSFNLRALLDPDNASRMTQALKDSGTLGKWQAQMKSLTDGNGYLQQQMGDINDPLSVSKSLYGTKLAWNAFAQMDRADQAAFFAAYSRSGAAGTLGELLTFVDVTPKEMIVRAEADHLAGNERPANVNTVVNINGADTGKLNKFLDQNYQAIIGSTFTQYLELRGDGSRQLSGSDLRNEIGMAMNIPPNNSPQNAQQEAAFNKGQWDFYTGQAQEAIGPVEAAIHKVGGDAPQVTVLPVMFDSKETGLVQLPLFRVNGTDGREHFVDNTGRTYSSIGDWKDNNKLPAGRVSYARDGHLTGANGRADILTEDTHANSFWEHTVVPFFDKVALVGGVIVAGALIIGTDGLATPIVMGAGGAVSAWGAGRAGSELLDRYNHGQTLSPTDAQARMAWLGFGANVVGLAALGASARVASAVARGAEVDAGLLRLSSSLNVAAQYTDTAAMADLGFNLAANWNQLTPQERMTQVAQMAFWGAMLGHNARQAGGIGNLYGAESVNAWMARARQELAQLDPRLYEVRDVALPDGRTMKMVMRKDGEGTGEPTEPSRTGSGDGAGGDGVVNPSEINATVTPDAQGINSRVWNDVGLGPVVERALNRTDLDAETRAQIEETLSVLQEARSKNLLDLNTNEAYKDLIKSVANDTDKAKVGQSLAELEHAATVIKRGNIAEGTSVVIGARDNQQIRGGLPTIDIANVEADVYYQTSNGVLHLDEVKNTPNALLSALADKAQFDRYRTWIEHASGAQPREVGIYIRETGPGFNELLRTDYLDRLEATVGADHARPFLKIGDRTFSMDDLRAMDRDATAKLGQLMAQNRGVPVRDLLRQRFGTMEETFRTLGREYGTKEAR
ncbi:MAG: hypothetical protein QOD00_1370 [Blastocatellia bacterium]|nr:hypothetical protein [Blastocatellia bacterium]